MSVVAGLVLALFIAAPSQAQQPQPSLDDLVRHFGRVLFGDEYGLSNAPKVVAKWQGEVGITIQGRPTEQLGKMLGRHLGAVSALTKIKFKQVQPGTPGQNIDFLFLKREEMGLIKVPNLDSNVVRTLTSDPTMVCFFLTWKKPASRIVKAIVVVNVERDPARINACLLEEVTQVMGLPNDEDAYWPTLFQPVDASTQHSRWDKLYLTTLYDPRMEPGMKPVDALYTARQIFEEALAKSR